MRQLAAECRVYSVQDRRLAEIIYHMGHGVIHKVERYIVTECEQ
jgi:hypothetical protein